MHGILNSIQCRDKLYLKLKSIEPVTDLYHITDTDLKSYNSILKKLIRQAKIQYYTEQFNKNKFNIIDTWSAMKEILDKWKNIRDFSAVYDKLPGYWR